MTKTATTKRDSIAISARCTNCGQRLTATIKDHSTPTFFGWFHSTGPQKGKKECAK